MTQSRSDRLQGACFAVVFSLVFVLVGGAIFLMGADVIKVNPDDIHAPRWVLMAAGIVFVLGGLMAFSNMIFSAAGQQTKVFQWLQYGLVLAFLLVFSSIFIWVGLGSGERQFETSGSVGPISTSGVGSEFGGRCVFGGAGLLIGLGTLWYAFKQPSKLLSQQAGKADKKSGLLDSAPGLELVSTPRLALLALTPEQLRLYLTDRPALEKQLGIPVSSQILSEAVRRAIDIKLRKLEATQPVDYTWLTYWLIVVKEKPFGAGLVGFKNIPDKNGAVEIGYGIDDAYENKGYMTESIRALVDWAFQDPLCKMVTATTVVNPASNRVLEKLGARIVSQEGDETSWVIDRPGLSG